MCRPHKVYGLCYWCESVAFLTKDHVVPRAVGGRHVDNIVWACEKCNSERGLITNLYGMIRCVRQVHGSWDKYSIKIKKRALRRAAYLKWRVNTIVPIVSKWLTIETNKLGYSPSAEIDLSIPTFDHTQYIAVNNRW